MLKTVKFGGSSLADANQFKKVRDIVLADEARKAVVVSAPGKRFKGDNKITDLLYLCYAHIKYGVDFHPILDQIKARYSEIVTDLELDFDIDAAFTKIEDNLKAGMGEDYLVSRGEALNAEIMACYLGFDFIDSFNSVFFNLDKTIDLEKTYKELKLKYDLSSGKVVVPGFFGTMPDGKLALMSRGGSDITGALVAAALNADMYENWTDVPGILMADPGIVQNPQSISQITYDELRELTYMGAKVLHEASVYPVRVANIPLNIRDTNNPAHPGTLIMESFDEDKQAEADSFYITSIAGRKGYSILDINCQNIGHKIGVLRDILKIFEKADVSIEQILSDVDSFSLIVSTDEIKPHLYSAMSKVEEICGDGSVKVTEGISLVAVVSRTMAYRPGISGRIFKALGENHINIRMISQGPAEINIVIGVDTKDYEEAIRVLYNGFRKDK